MGPPDLDDGTSELTWHDLGVVTLSQCQTDRDLFMVVDWHAHPDRGWCIIFAHSYPEHVARQVVKDTCATYTEVPHV